jgi:hypothetical protein
MMTATLDEIHRDPAILDRAIERRETLEILHLGQLAAEVVPCTRTADASAGHVSLPVHEGGRGLQPGVNLDNREQMWELAGGV